MLHKSNHGATLSLLYYQERDCTTNTKDRLTTHYSNKISLKGPTMYDRVSGNERRRIM